MLEKIDKFMLIGSYKKNCMYKMLEQLLAFHICVN